MSLVGGKPKLRPRLNHLGCRSSSGGLGLELKQVTIRELVTVATGSPRFHVKHMPAATLRSELHTENSREVGLFCLADETDTFILHNRFVGGDQWSDELTDYSAPVWETVVLRSGPDIFEGIATGPTSTGQLKWAGGSIGWNTVEVELLLQRTQPVPLAVSGALVYTTSFERAPYEFLIELELVGPMGGWRLMRSAMGPSGFTLATGETTFKRSA